MGDKLYPIFGKEAQHPLDESAYDDSPHEDSHALRGCYADSDGQEGERDAHDYRQSGAYAPDGVKLH